jgi:TrmH family RNA methyltransferase
VLTNAGSDRVARVRRLGRRSARLETGSLLVEGPQACREAALAGLVSDLYLTPDAVLRFPETVEACAGSGGFVHEASREYVDAISGDAQGVAAVARDPWAGLGLEEGLREALGGAAGCDGQERRGAGFPDLGERAAFTSEAGAIGRSGPDASGGYSSGGSALVAGPLVAVFERLRDPGNAGAAIRVADAAGASLAVFADESVDATSPKVVRASAGSYFHLPVVAAGAAADVAGVLKAAGFKVLAADGGGSAVLGEFGLPAGPVAWLFGNEANGLSEAALAAADAAVRIPIYGRAESLNVATAAALCLYATAGGLSAHRSSLGGERGPAEDGATR